jgi:dihydroorotate dehydrogenase (fumarate)
MQLNTRYMGMDLRTPLVASASPLTGEIESLKRLEDAGVSAVVLPSLFEEQILKDAEQVEKGLAQGTESFAESLSYFPRYEDFLPTPHEYLALVTKAKKSLKIPVVASLNGCTPGGWTSYARNLEQAGADALELNLYHVPTDIAKSAADLEREYIEVLKGVKAAVKIPVAVKLSPFFTSLPHFVSKAAEAGASGVVLFNRFYQPDLNVSTLEVETAISYSRSASLRMPLRWVAILHGRVKADFAASGGVHEARDVVKMLLAGASVTMLCSTLLQNGVKHVRAMEQGVRHWMEEYEYPSVAKMIGAASRGKTENPEAFERAQYLRTIRGLQGPLSDGAPNIKEDSWPI